MKAVTPVCLRAPIVFALTLLTAAVGDAPARAEGSSMFSTGTLKTVNGAEIYQRICQSCHMADGRGAVGAGRYPALARDVALVSRQYVALTILEGRRNMPAFGVDYPASLFFAPPSLTNEQVAAVVNYIRSHFGNHYADGITTAEVQELHHAR
jgi:mono/diheme cytochrome c family protein